MKKTKRFQWLTVPSMLFLLFGMLASCAIYEREDPVDTSPASGMVSEKSPNETVIEGESYHTKEEVAEYLHLYRNLPSNYLTKHEAEERGWDNSKGNLWEVAEGMSIGGDRFGNREGLLPDKPDRKYYEADINYQGGYRKGERLVFSNDGLIYYTKDHYESFEQLYGEEE